MQNWISGLMRAVTAAALVAVVMSAMPAAAQDAAATDSESIDALLSAFPEGLSPEQIDAILEVSDPAALRAALRERLVGEMAERAAATEPTATDETALSFYGGRIRTTIGIWPRLGNIVAAAFRQPQGIYPPVDTGRLVFSVILLLGVGVATSVGLGWLLRPRRQAVMAAADATHRGRFGAFALWLLLDACQVAAFFVIALLVYAVMDPPHPLAPEFFGILLRAALIVLVVERLFALLTSTDGPFAAAISHAAGAARRIYGTALAVTILLVLIGIAGRTLVLVGVPMDAVVAFSIPLSVLPFAVLIAVGWWSQHRINERLSESLDFGAQSRPARITTPALATIYLVGLWFVVVDALFRHQSEVGVRALASLLLALAGPLVALSLGYAIARYYRSDAAAGGEENVGPQVNRIMRAVWVVLGFLIVYGTALIWGVDPQAHFGLGSTAIRVIFNVAIVVLLGFVIWSLIVNAIDRAMRRAAADGQSTRAQRMKTLLPLLRRFLQIVLVVVIAMVLLSSLGIEIGPLLAGAGVVGIAIGLGAQQTIADILAGVFFLLEDSFRIGDYVEVGNIRGTVEGISMRSLKLRHHRGAVHTLPFGQMKSLTNYTRDWALMRLEFRVAHNTDTALVKRIVKDIGKELAADPELAKGFIEPLKSQGIRNVEDGAIVIGVKFIAKPNEQFTIRREAYRRILDAFRENGIELVGRAVVVKVEGDDRLPPQAAAAAASMALPEGEEA